MYIIKDLLKQFNEQYFKHHKNDISLIPFKGYCEDTLENNIRSLQGTEYSELIRILTEVQRLKDNPRYFGVMEFVKQKQSIRFNYSNKISRALKFGVQQEIIDILLSVSKNSSLVGGSIRDIILSKTPKDFDYVTDASYDRISKAFQEKGFEIKETGKQFLILNVVKNKISTEIACYRKEDTYIDGRRPQEVQIGTLQEDAHRRDFTCNALYYDLNDEVLLDPTGQGIDDCRNRILRFIGKPQDRLKEDYLRALRFYRFLSKGFIADKKSLKAVRECWVDIYKEIDPQRALNEIEKIVKV